MSVSGLLVTDVRDVKIVMFCSRSILDGPEVEAIGRELCAYVDQQALRRIILDFTEVSFLTSRMIGVLIRLTHKAEAIRGQVVICGLRRRLMRIFEVMKLGSVLQFAKDQDQALAQLGTSRALAPIRPNQEDAPLGPPGVTDGRG